MSYSSHSIINKCSFQEHLFILHGSSCVSDTCARCDDRKENQFLTFGYLENKKSAMIFTHSASVCDRAVRCTVGQCKDACT